jgi:hypothetical protein
MYIKETIKICPACGCKTGFLVLPSKSEQTIPVYGFNQNCGLCVERYNKMKTETIEQNVRRFAPVSQLSLCTTYRPKK